MLSPIRSALVAAVVTAAAVCAGAEEVRVEATALDGRAVKGRLVRIVPEIVIAASDCEAAYSWEELLTMRVLVSAAADSNESPAEGTRLTLTDGSVLVATLDEASSGGLSVRLADGQAIEIPSGMIAEVVSPWADDESVRLLSAASHEEDRTEDVAVVQREGRTMPLRGSVAGLDGAQVRFVWKDRELALPWERLAGLSLARPAQRSAAVVVYTRDGQAFGGRVTDGSDDGLVLRSTVFERLSLPWRRIERIESCAARVVYLSAVTPDAYEQQSLLGRKWPLGVDQTLSGEPIRLGGRTYSRGVTVHSRARLAYSTRGAFRSFAAVVGVPDSIGTHGDAAVRIVGDGRTLWERSRVRGGEPPIEVVVDVAGVRLLELIVDYGADLDLGDHVSFADARLIQ